MDELTLPEMGQVFLKKEWVMDPPPWIAIKLPDEVVQQIYAIKVRHLAEIAELGVRSKQIEAGMFNEIAKLFG